MNAFFNPWIWVGGVLVAGVLAASCLLSLWLLRPEAQAPAPATVALFVISAPSMTPPLPPTPTLTATVPPPPAEDIRIGNYVQVTGTGVDGLRMRDQPGLQGQIQRVAIEAEVFEVMDGPRQADGYTWWLLRAPYDGTPPGWAVANYLAVIQNP